MITLQKHNIYRFGFWYKYYYICILSTKKTMSKEVLEISVMVDEQFDMSFNLVDGFFGFILKVFGK